MKIRVQMLLFLFLILLSQRDIFAAENPKVLFGNDLLIPKYDPLRVNLQGGLIWQNKSYVPLQPVLTELGYAVGHDSVTKRVYAVKPEKTIIFEMDKTKKVFVNQVLIENNEILPLVKEDIMYIPAQFIPWIEKSKQRTVGNIIEIKKADLEVFVFISPERKPETLRQGKALKKVAYLTFDDGPSEQTSLILDILKENDIQATFFVIGKNIKGHEEIVKRAIREGNIIGNHTYTHDYKTIYKSEDDFFTDFDKGNAIIEQVTGKKPDIFRFPGGSNNSVSKNAQDSDAYTADQWIMKDLVKEVQQRGFVYFDWNVSTGDASSVGYTAESAVEHVKEGIKGKQEVIILSHDASSKTNTVKALPEVIQVLKEEGFSFGTLDHDSREYVFLK